MMAGHGLDWIILAQHRKRCTAGCCEGGNKPFCSVKCAEFLTR